MIAKTRSYRLVDAAAFKLRGVLMIPPVVFVALSTRWEWEYDPGILTLGLAIFLPGMILRIWSQRYLRYRLRDDHVLAVAGPYALCRNPVYIGNMLILAGVTVLCELVWAVPFVILWATLIYDRAVRFEETRLNKRYNLDYANYSATVRRWVPKSLSQIRSTLHEHANSASWARALSVEWQCLVLLLIPGLKEFISDLPTPPIRGPWLPLFHLFHL